MVQRNVLVRQKSLDLTQSRTAMKVLEKYCRKKYRHSTLFTDTQPEYDQEMTPEPLSPFGAPSVASQFPFTSGTYNRFSHLPSPTVERPQSLFFASADTDGKSAVSPRTVSDLFNPPIKEEIKQRPRETFISHLWRVITFLYRRFRLRYIVILLVVIFYSLFGGGIFYYFEAPEEVRRHERHVLEFEKLHTNFAECFCFNVCPKYLNPNPNLFPNEFPKRANESARGSCMQDIKKLLNHYDIAAGFEPIGKQIWAWSDYWNAVFFAWSLLTTIGYGNLSCHTTGGRVATIIYALMGIPLMLFALNALGKMIFLTAQHIWEQFRAKVRRKTKYLQKKLFLRRVQTMDYDTSQEDFMNKTKQDLEEIEIDEKEESSDAEVDIFQTFPMHMALIIVFLYIAFCSLIFSFWEEWDYFTAFYFFFISLSTIGLGDEVPRHPHYACAFFVFFVIGLALVSMCVSIMQMRVENRYMAALQLIDEEAKNGYGSTINIGEPETVSTELNENVTTPSSIRSVRPLTIIGAGNPGVKWRRPMMNFQLHATTVDSRQHSGEHERSSALAHTPSSLESEFVPTSPVYRMPSSSTLSGTSSTVVSTPPVLNALISRQRSTKRYKQRPFLREEAIRSSYQYNIDDNETTPLTERQWNSPVVQFENLRPPGSPPMQPQQQTTSQQPTPAAKNAIFNAPLSVITEASEEEIREQIQSICSHLRNSSKNSQSLLQQAQKNVASEASNIERT